MKYSPLENELRAALGGECVLSAPSERAVYDCDAYTMTRALPELVLLPDSAEEVALAVTICRRHGRTIVPRGAGTGLAGGCVPLGSGVVLSLAKLNRIIEINLRDRMALVEAGVVNQRLSRRLQGTGFHFAPDPASQVACTIGGNVATNAGGPHTLKYGVTAQHILGLEVVLADGSLVTFGPVADPGELNLLDVIVGAEGTLGIVTKAWVRLTPDPESYCTLRATFDSLDAAAGVATDVIAAGIVPAALELMERGIIQAVEEAFHFGFSTEAAAILIIELDGSPTEIARQREKIIAVCENRGGGEILFAESADEREALWKCRKLAGGAKGRLSPSYLSEDMIVPRTKLPEMIRLAHEIGAKHGLQVVTLAHAGDGNAHPTLLFDERDEKQIESVHAAARETLKACIDLGGSVTAEHGVGYDKLEMMSVQFAADDLSAFERVRKSFDPYGALNPGKAVPVMGKRNGI